MMLVTRKWAWEGGRAKWNSKCVCKYIFFIFQRFKAECDQNKEFLKAMKDYQKELLEQRHKNAEKDKETERLKVNMLAII